MSKEATGEGRVRVVGTAHVSEDSVREVEDVVAEERPDVVAVELDEGRYRQMKGGAPDDIEPGDLLRGNTVFQFIAYWMLSYVQAQLGEKFDVEPGADMLAAVETAEKFGIDVALVDRDINETMRRFWSQMSLIEKLKMVGGLAFGLGDSRGVGIVIGLIIGLLVGPLVGLFGGSFGIGLPILSRITGGAVVLAAVAAVLWVVSAPFLDTENRILVALGGGTAAGIIGGFGLGLAAPLIAGLSSFAVRTVGSLTLGVGVGLLLAGLAATLATAFGMGPDDDVEEIEELDIDSMTDTDVVSAMMEEFREFSPGGAQALIDERDAYIAHRLVALRQSGHHVVAVVGAGHREGIERYLKYPERLPPMDSLTGTPSSGLPWAKIVGTGISAAVVVFFGLLTLSTAGNDTLIRLFGAWFLINGAFAAGLAKALGARWPSALVGGAVAWMTSINPFLAPGWFTGYMELQYDPVNISDISRLNELLADEEAPLGELVSDLFDVPLFRLIMVVAATNIGSIVASALFIGYVLPLFALDLGGPQGIINLMFEGAQNGWNILISLL
ncbi:TraB/GumN family protein [Halogeometricum borinquense]|uniref:TraB/GumN family protein n=1 Tax=Halogeometricum borinquense TaxID=60847 RepID=A0A6C0UIW0_9EURY|nr:TraB/GumN family protein [Halogeometricum borinquense]QIB74523.1 TraB/GumN family protein [Halogeometricum borinquense]QIQ76532.1 TraB/GumN family protein [Halogeometricum borinquense]